MNDELERRDYLQTLERGLAVIMAFSDREPALSLAQLSAATGLTKPTVRRVLLTLERLGFARGDSTRFALTPKVLSLGYAYLSSVSLTRVAQPVMEALTDELAIGTSLAALDGAEVVYLERVQRHRITSINLAVGTRLPAHATSMGHVLLAALSGEALRRYLAQADLIALTDRTITSTEALTHRLDEVRNQGWAAVDQELEIGRRSAAAPVRDASGDVVAALSLSCGTSERSFQSLVSNLVPALITAADRISEAMGGNAYNTRGDSGGRG